MTRLPNFARDARPLLLVAALATGCATAPPAPRFEAPVWSAADDGTAVAAASSQPVGTELDPHTSFDAPPGPVQGAPSKSADFIRPYVWAAAVHGNVQAHGLDVDVDESFSDIVDALDIGFMLAYEHRFDNGNSLLMDSLYVKLTEDATVAHVDVNSELELGYLEVSGAFPVVEDTSAGEVDAIAGVRGWWTHLDVDAAPIADISPSWQWLDPIVGARWILPLNDKWGLRFRGDMGGFEIGSASKFTWQGQAIAAYQMSERATLGFGYRYLRVDRENVDINLSGFLAGLDYRF